MSLTDKVAGEGGVRGEGSRKEREEVRGPVGNPISGNEERMGLGREWETWLALCTTSVAKRCYGRWVDVIRCG